jgi:hypothetical protein
LLIFRGLVPFSMPGRPIVPFYCPGFGRGRGSVELSQGKGLVGFVVLSGSVTLGRVVLSEGMVVVSTGMVVLPGIVVLSGVVTFKSVVLSGMVTLGRV